MRFEIRHTTSFRYEGMIAESQNELRACPTTDEHQQLLHFAVAVDPAARTHAWTDYWGTRVESFGIRARHDHLHVTASATVETFPRQDVGDDRGPAVDALPDPAFRDEHFEFLQPTKATKPGEPLQAAARELAAPDARVLDVVDAVAAWTADTLAYDGAATFVGTTATEAVEARAGVCQDFSHVAVSVCRTLGIPARYVSGYLFTGQDDVGADTSANEVVVKTHAWMEAAVPGLGWVARDPTNQQPVDMRHIAVGRGRDYHDVAPLRGAYVGAEAVDLDVQVHLRRLTAAEQQQQ